MRVSDRRHLEKIAVRKAKKVDDKKRKLSKKVLKLLGNLPLEVLEKVEMELRYSREKGLPDAFKTKYWH